MTRNPLCLLSDHMKNFWAYDYDQYSRDEMIRLSPSYSQVVNVNIEDLNMSKYSENPSNINIDNNYHNGTYDNMYYSNNIKQESNNGIFNHLHNINGNSHSYSNNKIVDLTDDNNNLRSTYNNEVKYEIKTERKSENKSKNENFISEIKQKLFVRAEERQKFYFYLSEYRTKRFGGKIITETVSSPSATNNEISTKSVILGGAAIAFNWRIVNAVKISLPIEQSMKAR